MNYVTKNILTFIFAGLFFALSFTVKAIDFEAAIFPELAVSGRALAMGNAFIAKADDAGAAFYNPAGLGSIRRKNAHFHLSNFHLEMNKGWIQAGTGGTITSAFTNFFKGFDLEGTRQLLLENKGTISHSRFQFMPNFTYRYFSLGYLISTRTRATIGEEAGATFEYADRTDHGPYMALNLSLFGGVFKIGATGILLNRSELIDEQDQTLTFDVSDGSYTKGSAFILETGVKLTLPVTLLPTFAATMHNSLDNDFSSRAAGAPFKMQKTIDLGFSITPQIGKAVRCHFEVNYKDATQVFSTVSATRRLTMGAEIDIMRTFFFRFGYGDGFGSGGIGMKTKKLEFDLSTYAVDTTTSGFRGKEDRRFAMTISSGF